MKKHFQQTKAIFHIIIPALFFLLWANILADL